MIGAHSQGGSRGWLLIILRWAAALLVLGVLLHFLQLAPLREAIARVPVSSFFAVLLGYLLAHGVGVAKWRMVVNAAGAERRRGNRGGGGAGAPEAIRAVGIA
jgi:hypothetical protein